MELDSPREQTSRDNGAWSRGSEHVELLDEDARRFIAKAESDGDLWRWRRGRAVLGYIDGRSVIGLAAELGVTRGASNKWLQWCEAQSVEGLVTGKAPGRARRLSDGQRAELSAVIEAGPLAPGYTPGVWTGPMIGDLIEKRYDVRYHSGVNVGNDHHTTLFAVTSIETWWLRYGSKRYAGAPEIARCAATPFAFGATRTEEAPVNRRTSRRMAAAWHRFALVLLMLLSSSCFERGLAPVDPCTRTTVGE